MSSSASPGTLESPVKRRSLFAGWLGLFAIPWTLVLVGAFDPHSTVASDVTQSFFSAFGAVLLLRNAVGDRPVLGRGTLTLALGLSVWAACDIAWATLSRADIAHLDLVNLGYTVSAVLFGLGALQVSGTGMQRLTRTTQVRIVVDVILLGTSAVLSWRTLVPAGQDEQSLPSTLAAVSLSVADSLFLVLAVFAWLRAPRIYRRALMWLSAAAALLWLCDVSYAGELVMASYVGGGLLDVGWSLVVFMLGGLIFVRPRQQPFLPGVSRWLAACLPPLAAVAVLAIAALNHDPQSDSFIVRDTVMLVLAMLLAIRMTLFAAEQGVLIDKIAAVSKEQSYLADHDDLTGALDRRAFLKQAEAWVLHHRAAEEDLQLALVWIDVDDFKRVNDTFGHAAGDHVLRSIAERLQQSSADDDVVGRLGGDEFVVMRPRLSGDAMRWAERLLRVVSTPIDVSGTTIRVGCSAGLVRSDGSDEMADLIVDGDLALLDAKRSGRAQVVEFTSTVTDLLADARVLAGHVSSVVRAEDIIVRYQPVVELATNRIVGAEALARMIAPDGRELAPAEFLHLVELQGLLPQLFDVVLRRGLAEFKGSGLRLSINVTTSDITAPGFVDRVAQALRTYETNPDMLILELNERVAPQQRILDTVELLRQIGVLIALDDFGTRWSHIDQVRDLAPHFVKLDRELVSGVGGDGSGQDNVLFGAVALAKSYGARLIAEGIEVQAQVSAARNAGAELGQGWFWAGDLTMSELVEKSRVSRA